MSNRSSLGIVQRLGLLLLPFFVAACSSSGGYGGSGGGSSSSASSDSEGYYWPESDAESTAPGHAFTSSGMHFRKTMPSRKPTAEQSWDFYFKHCSINGNESHFSKTSYDCTGPFY